MRSTLLFILCFLYAITSVAGDNQAIHQQVLKAHLVHKANPTQDAKSLMLPVISICRRVNDKQDELDAWRYLAGDIPANTDNNQYRLYCEQKALALSKQLNLTQDALDIRRNIADIYLQQRKFNLAETELKGIINPREKASHTNLLLAYDLLSAVYTENTSYDKALFYALKTMKTMQTPADSSHALTFYYRLENIYEILGNYSSSLEWLKKCNDYVLRKDPNNSSLILNLSGHIVDKLIKLNKLQEALNYALKATEKFKAKNLQDQYSLLTQIGSCYFGLKQYDKAEIYYLKVLRLVVNKDNQFPELTQAATYNSVGALYLETNRPVVAKKYFLDALAGFQKSGTPYDIKEVYLFLFKADSALMNYKSAISDLQQSNRLKDSIFNSAKIKQVSKLQTAYNTEQKNIQIKLLRDKGNLQKLSLNHAESTRNWIIVALVLLSIIAALFYRQAKAARKASKLIAGKNLLLQQVVVEKEWLLKEVHHRVKNNLHTVICLLESQAMFLEDDALKAMESSKNRIFAMSLIHQKLYLSADIETVDMSEYVTELVHNLEESFDVSDKIRFDVEVDFITLNISNAIPLGLIINEAITNSIKHAFPENRRGKIFISMSAGAGQIKLEMSDNGIGVPENFREIERQTLGIELMKGLCDDINAEINFKVNNGTQIIITFNPDHQRDDKDLLGAYNTERIIS